MRDIGRKRHTSKTMSETKATRELALTAKLEVLSTAEQ
jgi:hypothetical protein